LRNTRRRNPTDKNRILWRRNSSSPVQKPYIALFIGTFRAIISKYSFGTQQVLLNLVCDLAAQDRGLQYPPYITDELLVLLGNMLEGLELPASGFMESTRSSWTR
jgi:hypothetical protein